MDEGIADSSWAEQPQPNFAVAGSITLGQDEVASTLFRLPSVVSVSVALGPGLEGRVESPMAEPHTTAPQPEEWASAVQPKSKR